MKTPTQLLWERFGTTEHPAEWDGRDGNGGIGSQRFWEYLWVLQQIGTPQSVLDVGGGAGFFAAILNDSAIQANVVDPLLPEWGKADFKSTLEQFVAASLTADNRSGYEWLVSISVLEHVPDKPAFCAALDSFDAPIALTFEFGPGCIEMPEVYRCLAAFKRHHITKMELCPVVADNSDASRWRPFGIVLQPNL
jgi:hypothetical protein